MTRCIVNVALYLGQCYISDIDVTTFVMHITVLFLTFLNVFIVNKSLYKYNS